MPKIPATLRKIITYYRPPTYIVKKAKTEDGVDGRLVAYVDKHSHLAEQYKVLRTNLYSLSPQAPFKTIIITSTQSQEGKTITACNLAYTLALDSEKKTLLIDTDLRRPAIHKLLGISRKPGISDVLNEQIAVESLIKKPVLGDLYAIPSGTLVSSPTEFLGSARIREMIDKLKARFDFIVFDTPPVINVTDSCILGSICDAVLLVVREGVTPRNMIEEAFTMLRHAQAKPKACILTDAVVPAYYYYLGRYRYYYKYRYGYRSDRKKPIK